MLSASEHRFRDESKFSDENTELADWLDRLATAYRTRGVGLYFLHLRILKSTLRNRHPYEVE